MKYRPEIDGLRALAIVPVILFHAGFEFFKGGYVGVDVFFVISGYLITSILLSDLNDKKFSIIQFYERRARRILPPLFFIFLICLPFSLIWLIPSALKEFFESLIASSLFISNIFFWKHIGYFDSAVELKPLIHTWSLGVEEQFYILFPLLLLATWRLGTSKIIGIISVILIFSLSLAEWGSLNKPGATFYLILTRSWELLIGSLVAFYIYYFQSKAPEDKYSQVLSFLGLIFISYAVFTYDESTPFPSIYALLPTLGTSFIILFSNHKTLTGQLLSTKPLVFTGIISYSAYLWHQPIFSFARLINIQEPSKQLMGLLSLSILPLAYLTWHFIEKPFRINSRLDRKAIFIFSFFSILFFIFIGIVGIYTNGFLFRYQDEDKYLASLSNIESGKYTQKIFSERRMISFDSNIKKRKILIIGDSFGQDLVNSLKENDYFDHIQISTRDIGAGCGNLFIDRDDIKARIFDAKEKDYCLKDVSKELFFDQDLKYLMLSADEIWLASNWKLWQVELITESINNIYSFSGKDIKIFGKKDFGTISIPDLLRKNYSERINSNGNPSLETITINSTLKSNISQSQRATFVDIQEALCPNPLNCQLFTDSGKLISYDGKHLTKFGAKLMGEKLKQELSHK